VLHAEGVQVETIPYGAIITAVRTPDRHGVFADIALWHEQPEEYLHSTAYLGALVGRYANRIAGARFTLDGVTHHLAANDGRHHLHGGNRGFDRHEWAGARLTLDGGETVRFSRVSPAGEEGYPGTLHVDVHYTVTDAALRIDYLARCDAPTVVNFTQHTYFNLALDRGSTIDEHHLALRADRFTPVDDELIPTGEMRPVEGTRFDFRALRPIGGDAFDHNWVLTQGSPAPGHAAALIEPQSGRTVDVFTTEPGLQFYTGNFLDGSLVGRGGVRYERRMGLCLETQHFPDSPNHPGFPTTVLRPGQLFHSTTIFRFGVVP
jgi:aldose 1-epimerase